MENENLNQLKEDVLSYTKSLTSVGKLHLIRILSRLFALFLIIFAVVLLIFAVLSFCAVACIDLLANIMPVWAAALIIAAVFAILIAVVYACRKPLFMYPFIRLMNREITDELQLDRQILDAEHKAELQRVQMECHVENATREINIYLNIFSHIWNFITGKLHKD